jgi:hypothetical protein
MWGWLSEAPTFKLFQMLVDVHAVTRFLLIKQENFVKSNTATLYPPWRTRVYFANIACVKSRHFPTYDINRVSREVTIIPYARHGCHGVVCQINVREMRFVRVVTSFLAFCSVTEPILYRWVRTECDWTYEPYRNDFDHVEGDSL